MGSAPRTKDSGTAGASERFEEEETTSQGACLFLSEGKSQNKFPCLQEGREVTSQLLTPVCRWGQGRGD